MNTVENNVKLKALPVQIVEGDAAIILKRGCSELKISGKGVKEVINWLIEHTSQAEGIERSILVNAFSGAHRQAVDQLISQLVERNIFVPIDHELSKSNDIEKTDSRKENIFFWNFSKTSESVSKKHSQQKLFLLGINYITNHLATVLSNAGFNQLSVIDVPTLRNLDFFNDKGELKFEKWGTNEKALPYTEGMLDELDIDCIVAASDFGGMHTMRQWNKYCLEKGIHFFPVVLQNLIGYVGPLVIPHETPCYECSRARQNSHFDNIEDERSVEQFAFETQDVTGFHPSMATILADLTHIELSKFYGGWSNSSAIGQQTYVHMLTPSITSKTLLKVPRCSICSPLNHASSTVVQKDFYMPGNEEL